LSFDQGYLFIYIAGIYMSEFHENLEVAKAPGYASSFDASPTADKILREGKILAPEESPRHMVERMVDALFEIESRFGTSVEEQKKMRDEFGAFVDAKQCVMSTPVMNNAGRYLDKPLSACTVPPVDLRNHLAQVKEIVDRFHEEGMGTGFNLDDVDDPVAVLKYLNDIAIEGAHSGKEDRPVGNMAILSADHPQIEEFIKAKIDADAQGKEWKFNISVNAGSLFMEAAVNGTTYALRDGTTRDARQVLIDIVTAAHGCGDPGLIFIDRMNEDNPTPIVGAYSTTAPCAEVGLAPGESCQFGYINLGTFVGDDRSIDWNQLERMTRSMTRALDNALEISLDNYSHPTNQHVMRAKRKIGVGVCGLADMLAHLGLPYAGEEAQSVAKDVLAYINYISKQCMCQLAVVITRSLVLLKTNMVTSRHRMFRRRCGKNWVKLFAKQSCYVTLPLLRCLPLVVAD
jgi:ribonucleoside-diphosphate reductase alpha chain